MATSTASHEGDQGVAPGVVARESLVKRLSAAVRDAYEQWKTAARADHARAHAAYLAAVDQEEAAANAYADLIGRVTVLLAVRS